MEIHPIGIDLGKTVFHLVGLDARGEVVVRKKCSRNQILSFILDLLPAIDAVLSRKRFVSSAWTRQFGRWSHE